MHQWFVPWGVDPHDLVEAARALPPSVAERTAPRLSAVDGDAIDVVRTAFPTVFVDVERDDPAALPHGVVPVFGLDAAASVGRARRAQMGDGVGVRVPLGRFTDRAGLIQELHLACRGSAQAAVTTMFVDVPCSDHAPAVILAASFGAVRRVRSVARWGRIVLGLDGRARREKRLSSVARAPIDALAWSAELADVSLAERSPYGHGAEYPMATRWHCPVHAGVLAEVVTNHREFVPTCCAGDSWFAETTGTGRGDVHSDRVAGLVHWIVSTCRLLDATTRDVSPDDPARAERSSRVGSSP